MGLDYFNRPHQPWDNSRAWLLSLSQIVEGAAVAPLATIAPSADDIKLFWTHLSASNTGYELWRSPSPYFSPGEVGPVMLMDVGKRMKDEG